MTKWEYWVTMVEKNELQKTLTEAGSAKFISLRQKFGRFSAFSVLLVC